MTKKIIFLLLLFVMVLGTVNVNAQVRIGGTDAPHRAAALDMNANDSVAGNLGLYLPRVSLTSVKQELNGAKPLNGAIVWNTNDDFYLGKGVYVWGDSVWVPIQRTLKSNSAYQSITTKPYVEIPSNSNPELGLGMIFQVPTSYVDWSNTDRFIWDVRVNAKNGEAADSDYEKSDIVISGTKQEMVFVPYDNTERTYSARAKPIPSNGTVWDKWSDWKVSAAGKYYQAWYRLTGPTGYDILATAYNDPTKRDDNGSLEGYNRTLTGTYTVEAVAKIDNLTTTYNWSIVRDETGNRASLSTPTNQSTVELIIDESIIIPEDNHLVGDPGVADTIILQCIVNDGRKHILQRTITVGDRDECSPVAGLLDAEGNRYTVSKFGDVCWMTQNLRSTWTQQGSQVQRITEGENSTNYQNAVVYYYPEGNTGSPSEYGLLYTWGAANIGTETEEATDAFFGTTSDRQGICPDGWTLPSDYDWNQLEEEIATHPGKYSSEPNPYPWNVDYENNAGWRPYAGNINVNWWGRTMKSPTPVQSVSGSTYSNTNGVSKDSIGFNALLVGYLESGQGAPFGSGAYFWSSSAGGETAAWRRDLFVGSSGVGRYNYHKYFLLSVRCKK